MTPSLSRTSSTNSISSDETMTAPTVPAVISLRRTRKRFTNAQLTMLENLFHQNSHPSREERENVAKSGGMEIKSVTIWFQNKRQTERKSAASNTAANNNSRPLARPSSSPPFLSNRSNSAGSTSSHLSLDRVASRSELRAPVPRTPSRRRDPNAAIWDNMPSSPITSPNSPLARDYVEFGKNPRTRRTLEWACAAARIADKSATLPTAASGNAGARTRAKQKTEIDTTMDLDLTDDEEVEAITPESTWGKGDVRWSEDATGGGGLVSGQIVSLPKGADDDDMMRAALALCGLGRRS